MLKHRFIYLFILIIVSSSLIQSMELPKLPSEIIATILIDNSDSLVYAIKLSTAFSQCNHESQEIVYGNHFISQCASTYNADRSLIALLLGNDTLPEYQEKKTMLKKYSAATELINNKKYFYSNDEEEYISNLKFHVTGILTLLKYKLPYNKETGLISAINEDHADETEFLLDTLKVPCDYNKALLRATKKGACSVIPMLIKRSVDSDLLSLLISVQNFILKRSNKLK